MSERMPDAANGPLVFKQDVMRITAAGAGTMERRAATAAWQVVGGALLVSVGTDHFRYRRLDLGPLGEERWLLELVDAQGQALTASEIMAVRVSEVTVDNAGLAKRWQGNINARQWNVVGQKGPTLFVMEAGPETPGTPIGSWRFVALTEVAPAGP